MHSEAEIRRAIRPLLDKYGELSTTEVKEKLSDVLVYDEEDTKLSSTRNEILILQRIGNIPSHQTDAIVKEYAEGFIVDKSYKPAKFVALEGIGESKKPLSKNEINNRKSKAQKFTGRKIDWGIKRERNEDLGNLGEEFVYEIEKERVEGFDPSSLSRVLHLSRLQGDGLGYDISSVNEDGSVRRIEVKTTSGGLDTPFYMSRNEKDFFETYRDDEVYVYRVYDFDHLTRRGKIKVITANELLNDYDFDPITFAVIKR